MCLTRMTRISRTKKIERKGNGAGFTLLEVLMAMVVLSVGILGVIKVQISSIDSNAHSRRVSDLSNHALERVEELMTVSYGNLSNGETSEGEYTIQWEVYTDTPIVNAKSVMIKVNHSRDREKRFYYMKFDKI